MHARAVLHRNRGVHEPGEERMFAEVIRRMPPGALMIELGSYWAFYSTWFGKAVPSARIFCVEAYPPRDLNSGPCPPPQRPTFWSP